jgi:hypothetical protein
MGDRVCLEGREAGREGVYGRQSVSRREGGSERGSVWETECVLDDVILFVQQR